MRLSTWSRSRSSRPTTRRAPRRSRSRERGSARLLLLLLSVHSEANMHARARACVRVRARVRARVRVRRVRASRPRQGPRVHERPVEERRHERPPRARPARGSPLAKQCGTALRLRAATAPCPARDTSAWRPRETGAKRGRGSWNAAWRLQLDRVGHRAIGATLSPRAPLINWWW